MKMQDLPLEGINTILLDRDGVINKLRPNDYVKTWDEFEFVPGILDLIAELSGEIKHVFIVTNQRGVGKGIMSEEALLNIHSLMLDEIIRHRGRIDKIYFCAAVDDNDHFRKPNIGMWEMIQSDFPDVHSDSTLMIGDSESDMEFARNCGIIGIKVNNA